MILRVNRFIGIVVICFGVFQLVYNAFTVVDYLMHPDILRLFQYPMHHMVIEIVVGILSIIAGVFLFKPKLAYHSLILSISYFYLTVWITDLIGSICRYGWREVSIHDIGIYFISIAVFFIPVVVFYNNRYVNKVLNIPNNLSTSLKFAASLFAFNVILNVIFGKFSVL